MAKTPSWDIASTCTVSGMKGLLLVEAKEHSDELSEGDRCGAGPANLGHSNVRMTLRYAHLRNRDIEAAAERIGQVVASIVDEWSSRRTAPPGFLREPDSAGRETLVGMSTAPVPGTSVDAGPLPRSLLARRIES